MISNDELGSSAPLVLNLGQPKRRNVVNGHSSGTAPCMSQLTVKVASCFPPEVLKMPI